MGKGKKTRKHASKRQPDPEVGGSKADLNSVVGKAPAPLVFVLFGAQIIFSIVFIVVGSINVHKCNIQPMIPIWLILMGIVLLFSGIHEIIQFNGAKQKKERGMIGNLGTLLLTLLTIGLFIAGNVFVYVAWGVNPDYGHYWFSNGCNMSVYILSFVGVIVMDVLFSLFALGIILYAATSICR